VRARFLAWLGAAALAAAALVVVGTGPGAIAQTAAAPEPPAGLAVATFAAGCFWCVEPPFDKTDGVVSTTSGYTAGKLQNPSYEQVSAGGTGHTEAVRFAYDPAKVSYDKLLEVFWRNVDPVDAKGQFCDKGSQYRPGIYTHDALQHQLAEASKAALAGRFKMPITVEVEPATVFFVAEDYHQDYYMTNPRKYAYYRWGCGRDARLEQVWGPVG